MRWVRWILALSPAIVGLALAMLLNEVDALSNPILAIRADVGTVMLILGCIVTMGSLLYVAGRAQAESRSRRQLAEARSDASAERRRFLQRLDHELKNPLTGIRLGLANLAGDPPAAARQDALASAEAEVLRLSRLTCDLRKLADLETCPLEHAPVDVAELLAEVVAVAQEQPPPRDVGWPSSSRRPPGPCRPFPATRTCSSWPSTTSSTTPSSSPAPATRSRSAPSRTVAGS